MDGILETVKAHSEKGGYQYTERELQIIREMTSGKFGDKIDLQYESLDDYEVPPRTQFSMLKKAAVTIKYKEMTFNMACIRLFEGIKFILPILSSGKKRLAVVMCKEEEPASIEWCRLKKDKWVNKTITSLEYIEKIFKAGGWDRNCRYKMLGRVVTSDRGLILVFDLDEAIMFAPLAEEYFDPRSGKMKKRRPIYYPEEYRDRVGKSYNDYYAAYRSSMVENLSAWKNEFEEGGGNK